MWVYGFRYKVFKPLCFKKLLRKRVNERIIILSKYILSTRKMTALLFSCSKIHCVRQIFISRVFPISSQEGSSL